MNCTQVWCLLRIIVCMMRSERNDMKETKKNETEEKRKEKQDVI